jgi:ketosteroid isomerase-like protein
MRRRPDEREEATLDEETVHSWVERYLGAWISNHPDDIASLFTEDARYFTAPHREPWSGRANIVEGWIDRKDEPGRWEFRHEVLAIADDLAFVRGWTHYLDEDDFSNLWMIRLDDGGRCSEFTEWWMVED